MKIRQLSIFLENKPGQLSVPCKALAEAGINILTLSLADTHQFGILRLIVRDHEKALQRLKEAGCAVKITEVVAIEVADRPGGLAEVLDAIEAAQINVEYVYALSVRRGQKAVLVFRFDDPDAAIKLLEEKGVKTVGAAELSDPASR